MTEQYPLSDEQIAFFREHGYVKLENVLTQPELEDHRAAMDALIAQRKKQHAADSGDYAKVFLQMVNIWRENEIIKRFVTHPRVADIARRLSPFSAVRLWHDHALVKMPGDSRVTPWHQDLPYWPMEEEGALSCWMALDDVDERNGCMSFVPGSHKLGRLEPINLVTPKDIHELPEAEQIEMDKATSVPLKAGSCTFHDGRTFHYAHANSTDRPRRAMVTIYMGDGTHYNGKPHVVTDPLDLKPGQQLEGEMFPLLSPQ